MNKIELGTYFLISGGYKTAELIRDGGANLTTLLVGTVVAAISAWVCIHYFLRFKLFNFCNFLIEMMEVFIRK